MSGTATVTFHSSQFPDAVRRDLITSLRQRAVNHKFHYDSVKQTQKWLELHQIYSPSRNDADCAATYDRAFAAAAEKIKTKSVHVIGLGCGGGQKDTRLLKLLQARGKEVFYTPCDVSTAMVLVAGQAALEVLSEKNCFPFVCDLANAGDLAGAFNSPSARSVSRLITFFGMIPNFEPQDILPKLAALIRPADRLLFSANLAPGKEYAAGMKNILPQYDNLPTREWLLTFLLDLGVERTDGELIFRIENKNQLKRVAANFIFKSRCKIEIETDSFEFKSGDSFRLFFSYRYTPGRLRRTLQAHQLDVRQSWVTQSGEEGIFLVRRG